jgi:hypothetical protein
MKRFLLLIVFGLMPLAASAQTSQVGACVCTCVAGTPCTCACPTAATPATPGPAPYTPYQGYNYQVAPPTYDVQAAQAWALQQQNLQLQQQLLQQQQQQEWERTHPQGAVPPPGPVQH